MLATTKCMPYAVATKSRHFFARSIMGTSANAKMTAVTTHAPMMSQPSADVAFVHAGSSTMGSALAQAAGGPVCSPASLCLCLTRMMYGQANIRRVKTSAPMAR
eukprot:406778_1